MTLWTTRTALETARPIMVARTTDPVLTAVEQAQCNENVNQIDLTLATLRADNTVSPGQRNGRATALQGRVQTTLHLDAKFIGSPESFYNALDLMWDASEVIRAGIPDFESVL